jgi:hypothetical protein
MIRNHELLKSNKNCKDSSSIKFVDYNRKPGCLSFNCCQRKTLDTNEQSQPISGGYSDITTGFYECHSLKSNQDDLFYHPNIYKYNTNQREWLNRERCSAQSPIPPSETYMFKDKRYSHKIIRITQV